jgi:hypothetical protein
MQQDISSKPQSKDASLWEVQVSACAISAGAPKAPATLLALEILGVSVSAVAAALGVGIPNVSNWRHGRCRVPHTYQRRLFDLVAEVLTVARREYGGAVARGDLPVTQQAAVELLGARIRAAERVVHEH